MHIIYAHKPVCNKAISERRGSCPFTPTKGDDYRETNGRTWDISAMHHNQAEQQLLS